MGYVPAIIAECDALLKGAGGAFDYAFCGGHAVDMYLGRATRPHGDVDVSAYRSGRNAVIGFMRAAGFTVYEALGGGLVHLISDVSVQRYVKRNIFCVADGCGFFHVTPHGTENGVYVCEIDHAVQTRPDFVEFLFNERDGEDFVYARDKRVRLPLDRAILETDGVRYFSPELGLLYKSTDPSRAENRDDFKAAAPYLTDEGREWLAAALNAAFPDGHDWLAALGG